MRYISMLKIRPAVRLTILACVQLVLTIAGQGQDMELVRSEVEDGCYFGVAGIANSGLSTNNTPIDADLIIGLWTTKTNIYSVYFPYAPEYAYQVELFDTNGVAMPKTDYGKRFGTKYFQLDTNFSNHDAKLHLDMAQHEPGFGGHCLFFQTKPTQGAGYIYTANDLFVINNPGRYRLQIRVQMIVRTGNGLNETAHIVRFPTLNYPLVKK
jgi:hypothetical protein